MSPIAIEINDVGLRASAPTGPIGSPSPGYAQLDRGTIVIGEAARRAARLKPRFVSHRHWDRMDLEGVGRPFPAALRHADLVYAHLSRYGAELTATIDTPLADLPVLLAVPATYSTEQLALLLGIARSAGVPVTGVVDAALAATAYLTTGHLATGDLTSGNPEVTERILHVDVLLQRAVLTLIEADTRRRRVAASEAEGAGLVAFQRRWADRLARRFVRETRFDPLHRAESEQTIYDRLPAWAREVTDRGSAVVELDGRHSIEITEEDLLGAAREPIEAITRSAEPLVGEAPPFLAISALAISARAARLPGLGARLAEACGAEPVDLPEDAAATGTLRHRVDIESPGDRELPLVLELPRLDPAPGAPSASATSRV